MRSRKLSRRELLMTSTALAAGPMVMHPFDAFPQPSAAQGALIARAKSLELDTPYVPPPGDALEHHASGFAKIICSAVFVTGLDGDCASENVSYFTAPYEVRHKLSKPVIDRAEKAVHVTLPNGVTRTAKYLGSQDRASHPPPPPGGEGLRGPRRAVAAGNRRDQAQAGDRRGIRPARRHDRRL